MTEATRNGKISFLIPLEVGCPADTFQTINFNYHSFSVCYFVMVT